jgi:predicted transposase YdaD
MESKDHTIYRESERERGREPMREEGRKGETSDIQTVTFATTTLYPKN